MVGQINSFINIVMIKQAQWFWSRLETTSLEDTLIKLGKVRISQNAVFDSHNSHFSCTLVHVGFFPRDDWNSKFETFLAQTCVSQCMQ